MLHRGIACKVKAAIGEAVRRNVDDAHQHCAVTQRKRAGTKLPVEARTKGEGHGCSFPDI
jgi:hypothetical protein